MPVRESKFPDEHLEAHLSKVDLDEEFSSQILKWIESRKDFLVYMGKPGCGKTYFCMAVKNLLIERKVPFLYVLERDFLDGLRECISNSKSYNYDLEVYSELPLLIYDDLGSSQMTEWQIEVLFHLIDNRIMSRKPTLITSNLFLSKIKDKMGERIHSRLAAVRNVKIESTSEDLRQVYI